MLELNSNKKFDIVLMNPPYGMRTDTIHLKFVDKCLNISNKQVVVMPFKFITKDHNCYNKFKESDKWNNYLKEVEEVNSDIFNGTAMENVAIYVFDYDKKDNIIINTIEDEYKQTINKIFDYKTSSDYDDNILNYLYNDHIKDNVMWAGGFGSNNKKKFMRDGHSLKEAEELVDNEIKKNCQNIKKLNKNIYLILSHVTGNKFFNNSAGIICNSYNQFEDHALKYKFGKGFEVMGFDSNKAAENCKEALQRPLMRFGLITAHDGLDIVPRKSYKYIPDIDWSNDKVKTDEGLLELCGCPKDKCKEYADYCKKVIDKVDKKANS